MAATASFFSSGSAILFISCWLVTVKVSACLSLVGSVNYMFCLFFCYCNSTTILFWQGKTCCCVLHWCIGTMVWWLATPTVAIKVYIASCHFKLFKKNKFDFVEINYYLTWLVGCSCHLFLLLVIIFHVFLLLSIQGFPFSNCTQLLREGGGQLLMIFFGCSFLMTSYI